MNVVWGGDSNPAVNEVHGRFVAANVRGCERGFSQFTSMGVVDYAGVLVAAMLYHNWSPEAGVIEISGASTSPTWLTRKVLWPMFSYPFDGLKCQSVVMNVSANNQMWNGRGLHRLLKSYGFGEYLIPRLRGRDEDGVIFILHDDAWRTNGFHRQNSRQE